MSTATQARKPLGVRVTPDQHRILTAAAASEHRSVSSFVLRAALQAAEAQQPEISRAPKRSLEEVRALLESARAAVREANPTNRDILAEFLAERREAGMRGE